MKVVILAGGKGSRISEESQIRPKPMVEIGGKPILWHIMKLYSHYGFDDFIICCGYKGHMIKDYFVHYYAYQADTTFRIRDGGREMHASKAEPWRVTLADTGQDTMTAGRVLKIRDYIGDEETFMLTFGDGVGDVDIPALLEFHRAGGRLVTISTTQPTGRFGTVRIEPQTGRIEKFAEKAREDQSWVNIGFMVMNRGVFDYLGDGSQMMQDGPFADLVADGQMGAYRHPGFWAPMDTVHDRDYLEKLWKGGQAPWKVWE